MRLVTVEQFRLRHFEEKSRPAENTVRRWLKTGKVPGKRVGGTWFIDEAKWLADGNRLVEQVLAG